MKVDLRPQEELKILRKIVDITASDLDLNGILNQVVDIVNDMTGVDSLFIYLHDSTKKALTLRASKIPHNTELGFVELKIGEGITGWVAKENKTVAIKENAYKDPRFKTFDVLPEDKYESFVSVPIVYKNKAIGVINLQDQNPKEYTASSIALIESIAKQVGGVIEHARLYEETKVKAMQFDALMKVSKTITSEKYLDEILNLIVVVAAEMFNSRICSIMLLENKDKELMIKATQSLSEDYRKKPNLLVESSLSGKAVKSKQPVIVKNVILESSYTYKDLAKQEGLTSMIALPMIVQDKVIGVVNVYTKSEHEFTKEEINMMQLISNQAAVAVQNTHLIEENLKAKEALETRKLVERAKGILMKLHNVGEEHAHKLIHKKAMDTSKSMKEIAESVILMSEIQSSI